MTILADSGRFCNALAESEAQGLILVVDDEEDIRDLMQRILRGRGYAVATAGDGEAALAQIARAEPISLILCNLRMPHIGGAALYRYVADTCPALAERFVFCSGDLVSEPSRQFLQRCGRPCLEKPFEVEALESVARQYAGLPPVRPDVRSLQRLIAGQWRFSRERQFAHAAGATF